MEEKCSDTAKGIIALKSSGSFTAHSSAEQLKQLGLHNQLPQDPSTSCGSMSLLQEDFANSQQEFAEVLDDETTTSAVLETYEINSSNSLPICSDEPPELVEVVADDNSSADTMKLVEDSESTSCKNEFFNSNAVYVINDDDDDDDNDEHVNEDDGNEDGIVKKESNTQTSRVTIGDDVVDNNHLIENGVIVTNNGTAVYLETPIVEQSQHHQQIIDFSRDYGFSEETAKPKCLNDEFLVGEDAEVPSVNEVEAPTGSTSGASVSTSVKYHYKKLIDESLISADTASIDSCTDQNADRMSFRLKKMNINNSTSSVSDTASSNANGDNADATSNDKPSSSHRLAAAPIMADIKSMDLIERQDFETEQRLTGGIILKSSSLEHKNMLNLSLIKSCLQQQKQQQKLQQETNDDNCPSSSSGSGFNINNRKTSSDSKCVYKDPNTTPTSSRSNYNSRLTKSTAKINLCSSLSHPHSQQRTAFETVANTSTTPVQSSTTASNNDNMSCHTTSTSVIVEAPSTSVNASSTAGPSAGGETFSNSNSNDSFIGGNSSNSSSFAAVPATIKSPSAVKCGQQQQLQKQAQENTHDAGCSRTSGTHAAQSDNFSAAMLDDAQPSTSSARCQYAPPSKSQRQVHASAQTIGRYLTRNGDVVSNGGISCVSSASNSGPSAHSSALSAAAGLNVPNRSNRRRGEPSANFSQNNASEVIAAYKVMTDADVDRLNFNEDSWVDCEENNSDVEEICTCHHSSSSGSSHGGSNTSLNETDDFDASIVGCGKDGGDLSNYIQMVSISEEVGASADCIPNSSAGTYNNQQRKRKYNESRHLEGDHNNTSKSHGSGCEEGRISGNIEDNNSSRKRIAYDYASTPRSSQCVVGSLGVATTPSSSFQIIASPSPIGKRTPRLIIPTRENPQPELQNWLTQFQRWSHVERLMAVDRLIEHCEPQQVRHMMKVIEPQFQRDFISLLPRELALQVLAYLEPKDLLRAAQTCRSWRFLCDDNLLWKEKCRKTQILPEPCTDRPKRGRAGNMPPIASPWKAAYMRQHIIEMNWRSRPIREPKVLKGHDDHVITCLQFSGNRIVSGSDDNTLKVWSAVTGRCLRTLVGHTGGVWSSQMSGNIIISGSTDRTLKVWDMETGQCVHTLLGHTSTVRCMHLHGNKVVSGSRDATLRVWDIEQGTCLHMLIGHLAAVRCVQYDGRLIVSGAYDYMVKIWHPERQECLHTLQGHTNRVYSLQFDGVHVVSGSLDTSIRVWDVETGNSKHTLMGHQSLTSGMELRQNILVSGNADSTVKVWDITTGQCLQTLSGPNKHQSAVTCLQFNSRFVVTSSDDGTVKLWDVKTGEFIRNLVALESGGSGGVVWRIRANDTKLICAVGSRNGTEETKLMVLDFDVEGACVKCS